MKSSSVGRIPDDSFIILRRSYIAICNGDRCAAMLLANFEFWHNGKLSDFESELAKARDNRRYTPQLTTWTYKSTQDLVESLFGMYRRDNVLKAIKLLVDYGFLRTHTDPKNAFNKTRYFELLPDAVNAALEIHSGRKIDSRSTESTALRSRKIDSLPYGKEFNTEEEDSVRAMADDGGCGWCHGRGELGTGNSRSQCGVCRGTGKAKAGGAGKPAKQT